jgi:hypothetical protein
LNDEYLTEEEHRVRMYPVVETPKTFSLSSKTVFFFFSFLPVGRGLAVKPDGI